MLTVSLPPRKTVTSDNYEGQEFFNEQSEGLESIFSKGNPIEDAQAINTFEAEFRERYGDDVSLPKGIPAIEKRVYQRK